MVHHLIIGGAGFVGSHVVERLLRNGHHVTVSDLIPPDSARNLGPYIDNIKYSWKSAEDLELRDFEGVDSVIFLASQADVPLALSSPRYTFHRNILGLVHVLELLRSRSRARLIYMSTKNVYGLVPANRIPIVEDEPLKPSDPYGASKAAADLACLSYANAYDMPIIVLRSSGVFGPRSRLKQVVPIFIRQALANKPITIEGDGCLPAGELIFTNPRPKAIEQSAVGDTVLSASGFGKVVRTFRREYEGKLYGIKAHGILPFRVTDNHPILVVRLETECAFPGRHKCRPGCYCLSYHEEYKEKWKKRHVSAKLDRGMHHKIECATSWIPAKEVKIGDYLAVPRIKTASPQVVDFSEFIVGKTGPHSNLMRLPLNEDWAYIIGLYIADGWTSKHQDRDRKSISISLNADEDDEILAKVVRFLEKYGFASHIRERNGSREITFYFTWLARWLDKYVGTRADEKCIPAIMFGLPESATKALIEGLTDGDGYAGAPYVTRITSSSATLLAQVQMLLTKLGKWGSIVWSEKLYGKARHPFGCIAYGEERRTRHWIDSDCAYIPVTKISAIDFRGEVYNIETTDNTYCNPVVLHNSQITDLNYVGNLVDAIASAAENGEKGVYNIAYGKDVSILELANEIIEITKSKSKTIFVPWRPGEKGLKLVLSIEKAKRELGYDPKISLREGLQKTVDWLRGLG